MLKFNPTTPIKFYHKVTEYVVGQGNTTTWEEIETDGHNTFYCEWKTTHGDRAMSAETLGVKQSATIRTFYNPTVYEKLRDIQVIVVKNDPTGAFLSNVPNKGNANVYEVWGDIDNVLEENKYMEFRVRRFEGK